MEAKSIADLTPKLREILQYIANGLTNAQIANVTGKTRATVQTQVSTLLDVMGANTRSQAVAIGLRAGVIE